MAKALSKSQIAATVAEKVGITKKQAVQSLETLVELHPRDRVGVTTGAVVTFMKTLLTPNWHGVRSVLSALLLAPLAWLQAAEPDGTNYDESKVPAYTMPDPVVCFDGGRVADAKAWREELGPEILDAFATNVYGRTPQIVTRLRFETTDTDPHSVCDRTETDRQ